jgi:hypothetical protein
MAKTKISEFSETPANNTDIDGINIAEGCAPSGINDAIRELMAQLKDWQAGTSGDTMIINANDNSNAALRVTQRGTANALLVEDSTNPDSTPFVIDASGNTVIGYSTALTVGDVSIPKVQVHGTSTGTSSISAARWDANTGPSYVALSKSRGASVGTRAVVNSGDNLGIVIFQGDDGTAFVQAAAISVAVDGTPGTNDMPGRLVFSTTADGAASPTERMRIDNAGVVTMSTGALEVGSSSASTAIFDLQTSATGRAYIRFQDTDTNVATIEYDHTTDLMSFRTNDADRVFIDSSGNVGVGTSSQTCALDVVGGIKTSRTAVTSPASTDGNVFSGTYTPSQVSTNTNVDSVTFTSCQYLRVGNTVTVSGQIAIDATTATTDTIVKMSVPIASNFGVARHLGGVGSSLTTPYAANNIACIADTTNDCVEIRLRPSVNTSLTYIFSFTYQVI